MFDVYIIYKSENKLLNKDLAVNYMFFLGVQTFARKLVSWTKHYMQWNHADYI
jgi:hypothetical protein